MAYEVRYYEGLKAVDETECPYNGWRSWATWHAHMTLANWDAGLYVDSRQEALRASGADAFAAWALPRYMAALRALGEAAPEIYAEPDAIDWGEVWEALRED